MTSDGRCGKLAASKNGTRRLCVPVGKTGRWPCSLHERSWVACARCSARHGVCAPSGRSPPRASRSPMRPPACVQPRRATPRPARGAIQYIYVVPMSHLDIGFTHSVPDLIPITKQYIDDAMGFAEQHPEYRWTIESVWQLDQWASLTTRSRADRPPARTHRAGPHRGDGGLRQHAPGRARLRAAQPLPLSRARLRGGVGSRPRHRDLGRRARLLDGAAAGAAEERRAQPRRGHQHGLRGQARHSAARCALQLAGDRRQQRAHVDERQVLRRRHLHLALQRRLRRHGERDAAGHRRLRGQRLRLRLRARAHGLRQRRRRQHRRQRPREHRALERGACVAADHRRDAEGFLRSRARRVRRRRLHDLRGRLVGPVGEQRLALSGDDRAEPLDEGRPPAGGDARRAAGRDCTARAGYPQASDRPRVSRPARAGRAQRARRRQRAHRRGHRRERRVVLRPLDAQPRRDCAAPARRAREARARHRDDGQDAASSTTASRGRARTSSRSRARP